MCPYYIRDDSSTDWKGQFCTWILIYLCVHRQNFGIKKRDWTYHVHKLELAPNKPKEKGLKCNIEESLFDQTEMEYLGLRVTLYGVKPMNKT